MNLTSKRLDRWTVSLPCPHNGHEIRCWLHDSRIKFTYSTYNVPETVEYHIMGEEHAAWFRLRWL